MENEPSVQTGLTPATLQRTVWHIRAGKADAADARRLMAHFCELWERQAPMPRILLQHLHDAFHAFLYSGKTLEAALGLSRKRGRPHVETARMQMAAEILRIRLSGTSHQEALAEVSEQFGCGLTVLGEAWATYKHYAIVLLRKERGLDRYPWSEQEVARLCEIYDWKDEPTAAGKSVTKPT